MDITLFTFIYRHSRRSKDIYLSCRSLETISTVIYHKGLIIAASNHRFATLQTNNTSYHLF